MATLVQKAKTVTVLTLPGSVNAQGTRGLLSATITFGSPITASNRIILSVMGEVPLSSSTFSRGPDLPFWTPRPAGPVPARTIWFGITLTDSAGRETMCDGVQTFSFPVNYILEIVVPNSGTLSSPGFVSWSVYASFN